MQVILILSLVQNKHSVLLGFICKANASWVSVLPISREGGLPSPKNEGLLGFESNYYSNIYPFFVFCTTLNGSERPAPIRFAFAS